MRPRGQQSGSKGRGLHFTLICLLLKSQLIFPLLQRVLTVEHRTFMTVAKKESEIIEVVVKAYKRIIVME
jgi:hypothetical protein